MAKLALFTQNLKGGGAERVTVRLAGELAKLGHKVDLVLCQAVGEYLEDVPANVRVIDFGKSKTMAAAPSFLRYVKTERPDAVLAALSQPCAMAVWAKRLTGVRTVLAIHSTLSQEAKNATSLRMRMMPWIARRFFSSADRIVACSGGVADDYRSFIGDPSKRLGVIYNPVLTPRIDELAAGEVSHPWFRETDQPLLMAMGRLTEQKNFPLLIKAMELIKDRTDARLVIFGEGHLRDSLQAQISGAGLQDRIDLAGFTDNPFAHFRRTDVFVMSSDWEGLPTVLIEAMACGAPIVSTDCPSGPNEILRGGKLGSLVPMGDPEALGLAILTALERGRQPTDDHVLDAYRGETVVRQYEEALLG